MSGAAPRLADVGILDLWLLGSGRTELSHTIVSALAVRHASALFASPMLRGLPLPPLEDPMHGLWCCGRNEDGAFGACHVYFSPLVGAAANANAGYKAV